MSQVKKKSKKDDIFNACVKGEFEELLAAIEEANSRDETKLFTWPYQTHPLHFAAAYGDLDVVRTLIEEYYYDAECRNSEGVTPLHFASLGGHAHVVEYLLKERQCNPNVLDKQNVSPLHYVCYSVYDNLKQPQIKLKRYHGRVASHNDNVNFYVEMLTRVCLVASAERMYYNTAMKLHHNRGQISIARNLILHKGSPLAETSSNQQPMLLELACKCGSLEDLQYFIGMCTDSVGIHVQAKLTSLLCIACNYEQVENFVFLVKNYVSQGMKLPNGGNILMLACSAGNLSIIKCIIELNVVSVTLELINEVADNKANSCTLKLLVENLYEKPTSQTEDSNMPYQQFTPRFSNSHSNTFKLLQAALRKNNFQLMRAVINESTITSKDGDGNTPLHWMCNSSYYHKIYNNRHSCTCTGSNLQFVKYLLSLVDSDPNLSGANVANNKGELPLHIACLVYYDIHVDIVRLVSPRCDLVNVQDHDGNTALHLASMHQKITAKIIQYLVEELGINLSCQNSKKELPLHIFCHHCNSAYRNCYDISAEDQNKIVKLLSNRPSCNVDIQDNCGQTPLHIVCGDVDNIEIVRYLTQEKQCNQNIQNHSGQVALHIVANQYQFESQLTPDPGPRLMEMVKLVGGHPTFNVNAQDEEGNTPLHIACRKIYFELIQYLVQEKQCDQNIQSNDGKLPLHITLDKLRYSLNDEEKLTVVKASKLVSSQPNLNIDAQDWNGNTPLHIACTHRNFELVHYLTQEKECKQNVQNSQGHLPLHIIIKEMGARDDCDMSALLSMVRLVSSQYELNFHAKDQYDYTPLHIACEIEAKEVVKYLVFEKNCIPTEHSDSKLYSTLNIHVACIDKDDISLLRLLATKANVNNKCHYRYSGWRTTLHVACEYENVTAAKLLLQLGCDLNVKNGKGELPLHNIIACQKGLLGLVELVADCDVNSIDQDGQTPLHIACFWKHIVIVQFLIENKHANPHLQARNGDTILHSACRSGATKIVRYLIESDVCDSDMMLTKLNEQKQYPFHIACTKSLELLKITTQNFSTEQLMATTEEFSCMHLASSHGLVDVVEYLVEQGCSPFTEDGYKINGLGSACGLREYSLAKRYSYYQIQHTDSEVHNQHIHPNVVRYLISKCFLDPTKPQGALKEGIFYTRSLWCPSLFEHACKLPNLELMKALTVGNINWIDSNGNTPLHIACKFRQVDMVEYLVQQGCDQTIKNHQSALALHLASSQSVELVKLLEHCNVDAQCSSGDTALHIACRSKKERIVAYLVQQRNCNTSIPNNSKETPISIAYHSGSNVVLSALNKERLSEDSICTKTSKSRFQGETVLSAGELVRITKQHNSEAENINKTDFSNLHQACKRRNVSMVRHLTEQGANTNAQNDDGDTPTHVVIRMATTPELVVEILEVLLCKSTSSMLTPNNDGDLPIHLACRQKQLETIAFLSTKDTFHDSLLTQNAQGNTPLLVALEVVAPKDILNLVTTAVIMNVQNKLGNTALHLICMNENFGHQKNPIYKRQLRKLGCDIHLVNNNGQLPLHIAAMHSWTSEKFLKVLINPTEMISYQDKQGNTPLHVACKYRNKEIAKYFLQRFNDGSNLSICKKDSPNAESDINVNLLINQGNADGDTPLHLAIQSEDEELVQYLVKRRHCNLSKPNKYGQTALHTACSKSSLKMVKMVFYSDSFGQVNGDSAKEDGSDVIFPGDTPLHIACRVRNKDIVKFLIEMGVDSAKAAMVIPNAQKELPIHTILSAVSDSQYYWSEHCSESLLKLTMEYSKELLNSQTVSKNTIVHYACNHSHCSNILSYLIRILGTLDCDVSIPNCDGDLPLHLVCRNSNFKDMLSNLKLVISVLQNKSAINAQNNLGNTPLHEVCKRTSTDHVRYDVYLHDDHRNDTLTEVVEYLIEQGCDKNLSNNDLENALFLGCRYQTLPVVERLLHGGCEFGVSKEGNSVLHYACLNDRHSYSIIYHLINKVPHPLPIESKNNNNETPLLVACKVNNYNVVDLLISKGANVSHADINGQTPITLATDPSILKLLLEHGADPTPLYDLYKHFFQHSTSSVAPPPTPLKVLVIGDPGTGKTTLVESLKNEDGENIRQTEAFGHTAGVIPNDFSSQIYGEVTMYDFAGHSEYYSSHGGVIHSIIKNSPPVIMVLVNLTKDFIEIRERALYWTKFVLGYCASLDGKPHLIIIGSHADILRENGGNPLSKTDTLLKEMKTQMNTNGIVLKGALTIDCTQSQSSEITKLRKELEESASELREKTVLQFSSHCLYVFIQEQFNDQSAVTLDYLLSTILRYYRTKSVSGQTPKVVGTFLPTDPVKVSQICEELNERGHVLFIKHPQPLLIKQSWIILKKVKLLGDVVGCLFAPREFTQHISLANSTGVVPFSKLKLLRCAPTLLIGFLTHMEYCQEILDPETLQLLNHEKKCVQNFLDEKYFFFPTLVSVETPCEVWKPNKTFQCGLILEKLDDFFDAHFIQVLVLRLAFSYAVKPTRKKRIEDGVRVHDMVERRVCTVWKSGIYWLDENGIATLIDVVENNKIFILLKSLDPPNIGLKLKFLKHRFSILSTIFTAKEELCPSPKITHYLLNPKNIQHPLPKLSEVSRFTVDDVSRSITTTKTHVINDDGHCLKQNELLFFEPYAHLCTVIVDCLYNSDSNALERIIPDDFLYHVCHHFLHCYDHVVELIKPTQSHMPVDTSSQPQTSETLFQIFKDSWQRCQPQKSGVTYLELRKLLDEVSLFPALGLQPTGARAQASCISNHEDSEAISPGHLNINDFKSVQEAIWDIRADWYNLAIQLDFKPPSLDVIREDCREVDKCFNKMLKSWLERKELQPTWSALVDALKSSVVNNPQLGQELKDKYLQ